jgi:transcriptional antiterminator RfaH
MDELAQFYEGERWYCVRSKPKKERMAAAGIAARLQLEVFCPQIRFRRKTVRGAVWFQEAMFPGYLFVRFDMPTMRRVVAHALGVLTIPSFNGRDVPIPDEVIELLRAEVGKEEVVDSGHSLEVGEETTVTEGSFQGIKVKVIRLLDGDDRVAVLLEMLGTLVEAEFPLHALEHRSKYRVCNK